MLMIHPVDTLGRSLFLPGDLVRHIRTLEWGFYMGRPLVLAEPNQESGMFFVKGSATNVMLADRSTERRTVARRDRMVTGDQAAWEMVHRSVIDIWRHGWCEDLESPIPTLRALMDKCLLHLGRQKIPEKRVSISTCS